jgi:type IV pilus assembly protein PilM
VGHWWQGTQTGEIAVEGGKGAPAPANGSSGKAAGSPPMLDRADFIGNEVVVSLSPPEVECTPLRVPDNLLKLEQKALLAAIRHEVSRNISIPLDEAEMDVWRLVPGHMESPNLMVAATRRDAVYRVLEWLDRQNLICRRIDAGPLAALRVCARMTPTPPGDALWGVLDVGRSAARLYIGIGQVPVYVRCMNRGGEEMTRRISEELGVSRDIAESYKRHYGVHGGDGHYRRVATAEDTVDSRRMAGILLGVVRPIIRGIGEEVQRSFRYAMGLYPDRAISGLWLIGGGSNLGGLPEALGEMLGIGVHRTALSTWPGEWVAPSGLMDESVPQIAGCLGLGLGEVN